MNEDLHRYALRVKDFLGSRSGNLQVVSVLLLAILLLGILTFAATDNARTSYKPLFPHRTLNQAELQRMELALGEAELNDYVLRDGKLHVPSAERPRYLVAVAQAGCWPESFHEAADDSLHSGSLIELGPQRQERQQHAREKALRLAIREIPGIRDVSVLFDEASPRSFSAEREITAQVSVTTPDGQPLSLEAVRTIHDMVLHFKAGLKSEQILITDLKAGQSYRGSRLPEAGSAAARAMLQSSLERQWRERLGSVLSFVPEARVAVHVRLGETPTAAGEAEEVRVSVGVPTSYISRIQDTRRRRFTRSEEPVSSLEQLEQETREKIQSAVGMLLPRAPSRDEVQRLVTVTTFDDLAVLPSRPPRRLPKYVSSRGILLAGIVLAFGVATYFWWTHRTRIFSRRPKLQVVSDESEGPQDESKRDHEKVDSQLRDRLQLLVEEDPDAAARSLADWIDQAG